MTMRQGSHEVNMSVLLGCIADDFTGGTDLADTLVSNGMRTIRTNGIPPARFVLPETDAVVVSVKCRSVASNEAVRLCRRAVRSDAEIPSADFRRNPRKSVAQES
jgi:hypothetical protein